MKHVLVTGGAGFIGSHLASELAARGVRVDILDDFSSGSRRNLPANLSGDVIEGSVTDLDACRKAVFGVDTVFHLAAQVSVPESVQDPIGADRVNSGGTLNVLTAARDSGVKRVIFSSSAAIYGETSIEPVAETRLPGPVSPYGVQKLTGEHYGRCFFANYGLETLALRYFNVYGPRQNPDAPYAAVVPRFLDSILAGKRPVIYGDGEQVRDFCSVHDVVQANIKAATTDRREALGQVFNIASGRAISINNLASEFAAVTGKNVTPVYGPARQGDVRYSSADIARAKAVLGFEPRVSLKEGLAEAAAQARNSAGLRS